MHKATEQAQVVRNNKPTPRSGKGELASFELRTGQYATPGAYTLTLREAFRGAQARRAFLRCMFDDGQGVVVLVRTAQKG
eukprot:7314905-Heterocapsa_arctica.AAC.1